MKRDKNFKLSKSTKRVLARYTDPVQRGLYKNAMIDAEIASMAPHKSEKPKRQ